MILFLSQMKREKFPKIFQKKPAIQNHINTNFDHTCGEKEAWSIAIGIGWRQKLHHMYKYNNIFPFSTEMLGSALAYSRNQQ